MAGVKTGISGQINNNIVTDGLVFYMDPAYKISYPGSGTTATDISSNTSLSLHNDVTFETDNNGIFDFDATDDMITGQNSSNLSFTKDDPHSISVWFRATNVSSGGHIINKLNPSGNYTGYNLHINTTSINGGQQMWYYLRHDFSPNNELIVTSNQSGGLSINTWYNATITYNGNGSNASGMKMYINAIDDTNINDNGPLTGDSTNSEPLRIGGRSSNNYMFNGKLGPVQIYDKELSSAEVAQNYQAQKERFGL